MIQRIVVVLALFAAGTLAAPSIEEIALDGAANIMDESHFGVVNGRASVGIPYRGALAVRGLFAPPFASSDFSLNVRLFGERVASADYRWYPSEVRRAGVVRGVRVASDTVLADGRRGLILRVSLSNLTKSAITIPIQIEASGGLDNVRFWGFARPATEKRKNARGEIRRTGAARERCRRHRVCLRSRRARLGSRGPRTGRRA